MRYILLVITCLSTLSVVGQDFNKNLSTAKSAYAAGNLDDARFAMQQMLNDIDLIVGRDILKMLPTTLGAPANTKNDNVTTNTGFAGVIIHRDYGTQDKITNLDIMSNSPLIGSINAILSIPFVGNSSDGTQKVVKVSGYKGMLQKSVNTESNQTDYTLQIPLTTTLITLAVNNTTEDEVMKYANQIPIPEIAKLIK